jgi:cyclomaltodextrinase / maltogenic alpha-amylase / neopullulanase
LFLYTNKKLRLRFHTAQNDVAKVVVLYGDPYWQELDQHQQYRLSYQRKTDESARGQVKLLIIGE